MAATSIYEALREDHERQRRLTADLLETSGNSEERRRLYRALKVELAAHATHEERQFYVPLMAHDLTQEKARHSVAEHKELDDFLEQLDGYDMSGPQWIQTARDLAERLEHHLTEEEREVFPMAGKVLTRSQVIELAGGYRAAMDSARAHDSPDSPQHDGFGEADRPPTEAESATAEKVAATVPDVGESYDEMARRGAETKGEGRVP